MKRKMCGCGGKPILRKNRDDFISVNYKLYCPKCGNICFAEGIDPDKVKDNINEKWNRFYADNKCQKEKE